MYIHEKTEDLSQSARNMQKALVSLKEEMEAIEWYAQRIDLCDDDSLKKILIHNAEEEKEHLVMILEWIRRNDSELDTFLSKILFRKGDMVKE